MPTRETKRQLGWAIGLYCAGVVFMALVTYGIKFIFK